MLNLEHCLSPESLEIFLCPLLLCLVQIQALLLGGRVKKKEVFQSPWLPLVVDAKLHKHQPLEASEASFASQISLCHWVQGPTERIQESPPKCMPCLVLDPSNCWKGCRPQCVC